MDFKKVFIVVKSFVSKNSPQILSGIGIVAITTGTVLTIKKARRAVENVEIPVFEEIEQTRRLINIAGNITEKEERKIIAKAYIKGGWEYVKYYAAPICLIAGGMSCMFTATMIQTKRLRAISTAYTALAAAFNEYRDRVRKVVGDEKEQDIFDGVERDDKGNVVSAKPILACGEENNQEFSRLFGDGTTEFWSKDPRICLAAIKGAESNLNNNLRYKGFVTLNEVWKELGFKESQSSEEGMYLGWRWKYGDPTYGNTYIDFGFSGAKNAEKCEVLSHSWNEEMWITVIPPHVLFGKLPKEVIRTKEQMKQIKRNRRRVFTNE